MSTLGLPRASRVARTIMKGSITSVQSVVSSVASASGHAPDAATDAIQPAEVHTLNYYSQAPLLEGEPRLKEGKVFAAPHTVKET